ncbi:MAG: AMP-binding protein, partial [Saprospiraceae bacterium]|nr:AMP-binding protein [Saprospiraceae bacterium]
QIRLFNENGVVVEDGISGEIQIKGPNVFLEYWQKAEATQKAFTKDGWFRSGDIALLNNGYYKILGRDSVDIIKSGGYKISALEIEDILRQHHAIKDCGVVGIPDEEWGELVAASLVLNADTTIIIEELKSWLKEKIPSYKLPRKYIIQTALPRNVLGKVTKNDLKKLF